MEHPRDPGRSQPERPDIRPLSRRASRLVVITAVVLVLAVAFLAAYILVNTAEESEAPPEVQEELAPERAP